ncbi:ABC transporter ATP-binding protein [Neobacillus thermocopriae]|uniref:ABC transporter ATP-binding protein n=1 Tax=Neobacillus thermocopriae TaxID=1215031 RepID=A0A6B3TR83_9BACI|nr:ABC transporter ATP-binding protein [Neobacillus thermocopriae]MED3624638.1 ABC transporter ATP-binding protein [Neobacillus thermocopriae]MED3715733.1 ABC transporter ATP-binding protein [Neobacillus thermocopriae]NEX79088.1 ABC transporter ATP-binding protein [Neobacillus thermocopriae]
MTKIIQTKNLSKSYGKTQVLKNIDLTIEQGEFTAIMGPSGSGKTTLLNTLGGIDGFNGGDIWIEGKSLLDMKRSALREFRQKRMGFIFQDYNLLDTLTVKENILLPLALQKTPIEEMEKRLEKLIEALNIESILHHYPSEISGGQKQRTAAARAIITNPAIVFADEPTGALDSKSATQLLEQLQLLNKTFHTTVLMITHDPYAASYCDRVIFLRDGRIVNEMFKGEQTEKEFFDRILTIQSALGGERR